MATQTVESGKGKKASRKNGVGAFLVDKIDGDRMRAFIKEHDLEIDADVEDEQLGVALSLHFANTVPKADKVRCDVCEGVASADYAECPYCGDEGEVEEEEDENETVAAAPPSESVIENVDDDEEEDEEEEEEEVAAALPAKKTAAKKDKETKMTTAQTTNGAGSKKSGGVARVHSAELMTSKDLDKAVGEVARLTSEVAKATFTGAELYWQLGQKILEINGKGLWKLRLDEKTGKAKYKSWDAFVHNELHMSPQHSYTAIDLAKNFESGAEVREIGQTKAIKLLQAAPQDRPALIEAAKAGATVKEIDAAAKKSKKKHGPAKKTVQAKAGAASAKAKAKVSAKNTEKVSITSFEGVKTIKLYKRPESIKDLDLSTCKRATKIGDQPFGRLEMANGLVQQFAVINKDGEWVLKIETRREEA